MSLVSFAVRLVGREFSLFSREFSLFCREFLFCLETCGPPYEKYVCGSKILKFENN
jgi:hypothetical protein